MNTERENKIIEAMKLVNEAASVIRAMAEEEREQFDEMSEAAQASEKGEAIDSNALQLEDWADTLDDMDIAQLTV